jgi:hypothetical protein
MLTKLTAGTANFKEYRIRLFLMIFNYQVPTRDDVERQMRWEDNYEWPCGKKFRAGYGS